VSSLSERTRIPTGRILEWLGVARSKFQDWRRRRGKPNYHNAAVPRDFWLLPWERAAILAYQTTYPDVGYRRMTYQMIDEDVVAVSPSSVYRVLTEAGRLRSKPAGSSLKGTGFVQPQAPHEHWHTDVAYLNICGTFYYLCAVIDGYSRYVVAWDLRESMTEADVELVLQRAREQFPGHATRVITDNGSQFVSKDFKEFIRIAGLQHVRTSPYYPQSNGKCERWWLTGKTYIRSRTPLSVDDARKILTDFIAYYNGVRLHSSIGYVTPQVKLEGRADAVIAERQRKLAEARNRRLASRGIAA